MVKLSYLPDSQKTNPFSYHNIEDFGKTENSFNLYHSLGIFNRRQIDDSFLNFPRKQDTTFHARDNLHEMSNPVSQEK